MTRKDVIQETQKLGNYLKAQIRAKIERRDFSGLGQLVLGMCYGVNEDMAEALGLAKREDYEFAPKVKEWVKEISGWYLVGSTGKREIVERLYDSEPHYNTTPCNAAACLVNVAARAHSTPDQLSAKIFELYTLCTMDEASEVYPLQVSEALSELPCLLNGLGLMNLMVNNDPWVLKRATHLQYTRKPIRVVDDQGKPLPETEEIPCLEANWFENTVKEIYDALEPLAVAI